MVWGVYTRSPCAHYDAGQPFWPCEAPNYFLSLFNFPAIAAAHGLLASSMGDPANLDYVVELPLIVLWWWFVGTRADFGLLGLGRYRRRLLWVSLLVVAAVGLICLLGWSIRQEISLHQRYPHFANYGYLWSLSTVRSAALYPWLVFFICIFAIAAVRIFRNDVDLRTGELISQNARTLSCLIFMAYLIFAGIIYWRLHVLDERQKTALDLKSMIVKGKILDELRAPIVGIKVDLVPLFKTGDAQWSQAVSDWTDEKGDYILRPEEVGDYFLSVLWQAAPDKKQPFLTRYYPDAPDEAHAEKLNLKQAQHLTLAAMQLHRLDVVRVPVKVVWSNGKPEPDAYLFFTNSLFPKQGAIGNEGVYPDSEGRISLPADFDYKANAQVECDGESSINHEYSISVNLSTRPGAMPNEPLLFVLPGTPCKVWHPK